MIFAQVSAVVLFIGLQCIFLLTLVNITHSAPETSHITILRPDVLYRAHSGLFRDTKCLEVSP